jgi:hypothetical protein
MDSFVAWMSFSESERRRVMDAIDTLRQKDARDELGLGAIRDGFADLFFPGTGTVQTRARYFLFVPWIYRDLEAKGKDPAEVPRLARDMELGLIDALEEEGETEGVIGVVARRRLKRLPSNIYWLGMQRWRICSYVGGQDDFHRFLRRRRIPVDLVRNDDGEALEDGRNGSWHGGLPPKPPDFPKKASFALTRREAEYLRERISTTSPGTLLSFLVREDDPWEPVGYPWEHPSFGAFPVDLQELLRQARRFSEAMHGAAILYNLLLAEDAKSEDVETFKEWLGEWATERRKETTQWPGEWPDASFWAAATRTGRAIGPRTRAFVREWIGHLSEVAKGGDPGSKAARALVKTRELEVKGPRRARLHNESARMLWNGAAGLARIEYRWTNAQRVLLDIQQGLSGRASHA